MTTKISALSSLPGSPDHADLFPVVDVSDTTQAASGSTKKVTFDELTITMLRYKGTIDAQTNPNYPAALQGDIYEVSSDGKVGGSSGSSAYYKNILLCIADNAGGTEASVGASWFVVTSNVEFRLIKLKSPISNFYLTLQTSTLSADTSLTLDKGVASTFHLSYPDPVLGGVNSGDPFGMPGSILSESHASNAVTFRLNHVDGSTPGTGAPLYATIPNDSGGLDRIAITSQPSITISSGSTLGATSGVAFNVWIVGFNDSGTFRMGVVNCWNGSDIFRLSNDMSASSIAEGGAGAADSAAVIYTGTAVTTKRFIVIGRAEYNSGLTTAGTWVSSPTKITLYGSGSKLPGDVVNCTTSTDNTFVLNSATIPSDDTKPQSSEGTQVLSATIVPRGAANLFRCWSLFVLGVGSAQTIIYALFRDSGADALCSGWCFPTSNNNNPLNYELLTGSISSTTFKIRAGASLGSSGFNGAGSRFMGGTFVAILKVEELQG